MTLIPLRILSLSDLNLMAYKNWCRDMIGPESAGRWWVAEPVDSGMYQNAELYATFRNAGALYSMVFNNAADATAFRLYFGL